MNFIFLSHIFSARNGDFPQHAPMINLVSADMITTGVSLEKISKVKN